MVLQRDVPVPVWGWAKESASIEVRFSGQVRRTIAGDDGKWRVDLSPLTASSRPLELTILADSDKTTINDVIVGEVWLASGQSNMECGLRDFLEIPRPAKYAPLVEYIQSEMNNANDSLLRQFRVEEAVSFETPKKNCDGHWTKSCPEENETISASAYFFARELRRELDVPIGIVLSASGGSLIEPWVPQEVFSRNETTSNYYLERHQAMQDDVNGEKEQSRYQEAVKQWESEVTRAKVSNDTPPEKPRVYSYPNLPNRQPASYFNAMIAPLAPFAIKGAIWYQGEANRQFFPERYGGYLGGLITAWRELWNQGDFPFFFAQLPNFLAPPQFPNPPGQPSGADGWVTVSDQQRQTLSVANTGMAILNDVGEAEDIHPINKIDAGRRLSMLALAKTYELNLPAHSGPLYESSNIVGQKIVVSFAESGSGLMVGRKHLLEPATPSSAPLGGFEIAGDDDEWLWATAKIITDNQVELHSDNVPNPVAVRYAWQSSPERANLYNKEGLPASLFSSNAQ